MGTCVEEDAAHSWWDEGCSREMVVFRLDLCEEVELAERRLDTARTTGRMLPEIIWRDVMDTEEQGDEILHSDYLQSTRLVSVSNRNSVDSMGTTIQRTELIEASRYRKSSKYRRTSAVFCSCFLFEDRQTLCGAEDK